MYRRLISGLFILFCLGFVHAQTEVLNTEANSYTLYTAGKWKQMLIFHDSLHRVEVDYYYLRIRSAWAHYYLEEPFKALQELDAAHRFWNNPADADFRNKLLLIAGEPFAADRALGQDKRPRGLFPSPFIRMLRIEAGVLQTTDKLISSASELMNGATNLLGTQDVLKQINTASVALQHTIIPGLAMYHEITGMQLNRVQETGWRNGYKTYPYTGQQFQYYLSGEFQTTRGWKFSPAFHYIYYKRVTEWTETTLPLGSVVSGLDTLTLNNHLVSGEISKRIGNYRPSFCITGGSLNFGHPIQLNSALNWYPEGNQNSFIRVSFTLHMQDGNSEFIPGISGGKRLGKRWYSDAGFTIGNMYNYSEYNAQLLFNISDIIKWKAFGGIKYLHQNISVGITLPVQQRQRESVYVIPLPPNDVGVESKTRTYLAGGLLLNFQYNFTSKSL
jgi:hypothetical protein